MHSYANVPRYSNMFIASQRNFIDEEEMRAAALQDAREPDTHKAWRDILEGHSHIRAIIGNIRCALFDMGSPLSLRGETYIENLLNHKFRWHDPNPLQSMRQSYKALANCRARMPRRWALLRTAEARAK